MDKSASNQPFWFPDGDNAKFYTRLTEDVRVDVAVVGGGIVGLTAAYLLEAAGKDVAVLEARQIGRQATGRSTAKVTSQHGKRYSGLIDDIGKSGARLYAVANERALARIRAICDSQRLDCGLETMPAYIFAETEEQAASLRKEADAAASLDLPAAFVSDVDLPFPVIGALRFEDQAQFDPYRYLIGLAEAVAEKGLLFERTRVTEVEHGEPCRVQAGDACVMADHVIVATQMPVISDGLFFAKAYPYAHPVAAAPLAASFGSEGMFISAASPSRSFRTAEKDGATYLVAAGAEFKAGQTEDESATVDKLRNFLRISFQIENLSNFWINEDFRPMDNLPFIGRASESTPRFLIATGFDAWGITQGTSAAEIIADIILGQKNEAAELFDATRLRPLRGGRRLLSENLKTGEHLVRDRLFGKKSQTLDEIPAGQGGIVELDGEQLAVLKDGHDVVNSHSAVCTHLGCIVGWNNVDRSWDCPCHGSRFDTDGQVISGPAISPLEKKELTRKWEE